MQVLVRTSPFDGVTGTFRTDYDGRYSRFRSFSADAGWEPGTHFVHRKLEQRTLPPRQPPRPWVRTASVRRQYFNSYTEPAVSSRTATASPTQLNWDVKNQSLLQHRIAGYYNAQCCGFSAEYQFIDLSQISTIAVQQDSRFHFSVTLGGIGNVSNIFGAMGGTGNR